MPSHQTARSAHRSTTTHKMHIAARHIRPGDYLPPQPVLRGTPHEHDGYAVGEEARDVLPGLAVTPGQMLLYGPAGALDSVAHDAQVTVRRCAWRPHPGPAMDNRAVA
jgi:hypothetical protein